MKVSQTETAGKRPYRMSTRATAAAATGQRILQAFLDLYMVYWLEDLTLDEVAARAGVSVQTVLRRYRSKAGLIQAAGESLYQQVSDQRNQAPVGDIAGAVANLMDHYEAVGDLTIRTLAQEQRHEALRTFAERGRALHRAWVETAFSPHLEGLSVGKRGATLAKLVVVTDLYAWKLLRRDMGFEREQTERYVVDMVSAMIERKH
ncbi:MAG TPA: TetR/AcrR family transcriptional regulator [Ktedonobacterales bacterium]|jgi:AcrR family transcriptional regulator|nr:TetR/AcrR family transcriptional regulator [Ktedonobacterales bacterium]